MIKINYLKKYYEAQSKLYIERGEDSIDRENYDKIISVERISFIIIEQSTLSTEINAALESVSAALNEIIVIEDNELVIILSKPLRIAYGYCNEMYRDLVTKINFFLGDALTVSVRAFPKRTERYTRKLEKFDLNKKSN